MTTTDTSIEAQATGLITRIEAMAVNSEADYKAMGEALVEVKTMIKAWDAFHEPNIRAAQNVVDVAKATRDSVGKPLAALEKTVMKPRMLTWWESEQAKIRAAKEAQVREQQRLNRIAEEKRLAEAQAKEDEARAQKAEADRKEAEAKALMDQGETQQALDLQDEAVKDRMTANTTQAQAEAVLDKPLEAPVALIPPAPPAPKASGTSVRLIWKARVDDLQALAKAVGEGKVGTNCLEPVNGALVKIAQAFEGKQTVPGVVFYQEPSMSARGR